MSCFPCISPRKRTAFENDKFNPYSPANSSDSSDGPRRSSFDSSDTTTKSCLESSEPEHDSTCSDNKPKSVSSARRFTYHELAVATRNFRDSHLIGEGGFGKVFKGRLEDGQVIAAKRLNLESLQGNQEFIVEVLMLSLLHDPNLVTLIGYCAEGDQRILVYEYMAKGSLADHLFGKHTIDWTTRLKIAAGAARGMKYLHCVAKPAVIYRDVKSANILLDEDFNPKLSDFGLAKLGPQDDKTHVSTRVMGTYGYCAPEYAASGKLSPRSDIYSFGVVLMEILTGRKALDSTKNSGEQNLVLWSRRIMKDKKRHTELIDPRLKGHVPSRSFRRYLTVTDMCLRERANLRPSMEQIVGALDFLAFEAQATGSTSAPSTPTASTPPASSPLFSHHNKFFSPRKNSR